MDAGGDDDGVERGAQLVGADVDADVDPALPTELGKVRLAIRYRGALLHIQSFADSLHIRSDRSNRRWMVARSGRSVCPFCGSDVCEQNVVASPDGAKLYVLVRQKGEWWLAAGHNTLVPEIIAELKKRGQEIGLTGACVGGGQGAGSVIKVEG